MISTGPAILKTIFTIGPPWWVSTVILGVLEEFSAISFGSDNFGDFLGLIRVGDRTVFWGKAMKYLVQVGQGGE